MQHPLCFWATSYSLVQTGTRCNVLTYTGIFSLFWSTWAVTQATGFSLVSKLKAEVGLISHQKGKDQWLVSRSQLICGRIPGFQRLFLVAKNKSEKKETENHSDHSWEHPVRNKKDDVPECIYIPNPALTDHSPWQPSKKPGFCRIKERLSQSSLTKNVLK